MSKKARKHQHVEMALTFEKPWVVKQAGKIVARFSSQMAALNMARQVARKLASDRRSVSLRVRGRRDRIQYEWTYPKRLDPKRTKS